MNPLFAKHKAISSRYVPVMADLVANRGGDRHAFLDRAGLQDVRGDDFFTFITLEQYEALLQAAIDITGDDAIGLYLGESIQFSDHGTFAYSALSFPSVWDALQVGLKFSQLANHIVDLSMEEGQHYNSVRFDTAYFTGALYQTLIETVMSVFCEILRFMLNENINAIRIDVCYSAPPYAAQYHNVFPSTVSFDTDTNAVHIPKNLANQPQSMANTAIAEKFEQECEALIETIHEPKSIPQQVHDILFLSQGHFPQLHDIAHRMNMSPRTLRRRLQESDTSYKVILENVRIVRANRYLSTTTLNVGKIAELLGYTDQNSFSYAYKQLAGVSPTQYRKTLACKR